MSAPNTPTAPVLAAGLPTTTTTVPTPAPSGGSFLSRLPGMLDSSKAQTTPVVAPDAPAADDVDLTPVKTAPEPVSTKTGLSAFEETEAETPKADDTEDAPPDVKTPEARNAWSGLKKEAKTLREEKAQWEKERLELLEKAKISDADPLRKENEALRLEKEAIEKEAAQWRIERTPEYIKEIVAPWDEMAKQTAAFAKAGELDGQKIWDAITEPNNKEQKAKLLELKDHLDEVDFSNVMSLCNRGAALHDKESIVRANAVEALKEATAREAERNEQARVQARAAEVRAVMDHKDKLLAAVKRITPEGTDAETYLNQHLKEVSENSFADLDPNVKAFSLIMARLGPEFYKHSVTLEKKVASLTKELKALTGASPSAREGVAPSATTAQTGKSFFERITGRQADFLGATN
jgi:hypothetical protein